jgi:ATP-dependent DNA helicase DinG
VFGVPSDLPQVNAGDALQEATARVLADLAGITGGGIFGLFTSHRALRAVARHLREAGVERRWPLLVEAILLGTASFWEGVDVPGRPLRGLVIQKLPFRVPTEPITQARMEAIEARGASPFDSYLVPLAALRLKQGFGRLIRSRTDRGAVVLLDSRILTKAYGRSLLAALPDSPLLRGPWAGVRAGLDRFYGEA